MLQRRSLHNFPLRLQWRHNSSAWLWQCLPWPVPGRCLEVPHGKRSRSGCYHSVPGLWRHNSLEGSKKQKDGGRWSHMVKYMNNILCVKSLRMQQESYLHFGIQNHDSNMKPSICWSLSAAPWGLFSWHTVALYSPDDHRHFSDSSEQCFFFFFHTSWVILICSHLYLI